MLREKFHNITLAYTHGVDIAARDDCGRLKIAFVFAICTFRRAPRKYDRKSIKNAFFILFSDQRKKYISRRVERLSFLRQLLKDTHSLDICYITIIIKEHISCAYVAKIGEKLQFLLIFN